ncbi:LuxR C-terminal-related transcriptional regulator [Pseudomonas vancouverensis]|uniref:LuxR C-terminal-related transcriptional regulator n=1 Tax=Pseudomonas vancouverensis TaxID=95300 RepID=UPI003D054F37
MPPRRGRGNLPRPRLEQLIDQIAESSLTVLKAPPGFGKSTLASAWAQAALARGAQVAWLTLDEADDSPERILLYVAAAIAQSQAVEAEQSLLKNFALLPAEHLSTLLLNDLGRREQACFLFVDDCHCAPAEAFAAAFDQLIRYAPDNLHLVFCGRNDLPASLYAHLYSDACLEVDGGQLRFDLDETRDLLLRSGFAEIDAGELLDLHRSTQGWIAALRASLLSIRQRPGASARLPKSISGLLDELLKHLPPSMVEQLSRLACVDKFNTELTARLTGHPDARALIDELDRLQLFLSCLDDAGDWFSFHPLFREHLRRRLSPVQLSYTLSLAARWFADQQLWTDAVRSALAAGDNESAQQWIAHCAMDLVERGDFIILLDWQRQLRDHLLQSPPQLKLAMAWASGLAMTHSNSLHLLSEVEADLAALGRLESTDALFWECQALHAMLKALGDDGQAGGELAIRCLPHLSNRPWICNTLLNVVCFSHLSASRWEAFYSLPPVICEPLERSRYLFNQIYRLSLVGFGESLQGRFSQAAAILEEALRLTTPVNASGQGHSVLRALPASFLAAVRYLQGREEEAAQLSLENIEFAKLGGFLDCIASVYITASRLSSSHSSHQGARYFLEDGERLAQTRQWPRLQAYLLLERIRVSLIDHKQHEAQACAQQLEQIQTDHSAPATDNFTDYQYLASLAALWCETAGISRPADLVQAQKIYKLAAGLNQRLKQARLAASLAQVYWVRQQKETAVTCLLEACQLADHSGAYRLLKDLPATDCLQQLTRYALQDKRLSQARLAQLQRLIPDNNTATQQTIQARTAIALTSKERNVLELVSHGKSNKEMAKLLGITPETIKSHMKNIFGKLKVDSRAQAAVIAKAHGLI